MPAAGPNAGPDAVPGEPSPPPASAIPAAPGEENTLAVFSRGSCFFSTKIAAGQDLGYDVVIIEQSHGGTRNGLLPDSFFCGGQGHDYDERIPAICVGHRGVHLMFNDPPQYTDPAGEGRDIPVGALGAKYARHDGVRRLGLRAAARRARREPARSSTPTPCPRRSTRTSPRAAGTLSVHEVKTDPRTKVDLAYISYYNAGARVVKLSHKHGIVEKGFFIDEGGNHFWGTFPHRLGKSRGAPLLLFSDRDRGLYILRYTG